MLDSNQMSNLDQAERDIRDRKLILDTAIDVQAMLRFMVDRDIITKEEMNKYREEVRKSPKYATALTYVEQTLNEIEMYKRDPQAQLRRMFDDKLKGRR